MQEESGIIIDHVKILGIEHYIKRSTTVVIFSGKPVGGMLTQSNETSGAGYFTFAEGLKLMKLASFKERLKRSVNEKNIPFFLELWTATSNIAEK